MERTAMFFFTSELGINKNKQYYGDIRRQQSQKSRTTKSHNNFILKKIKFVDFYDILFNYDSSLT